MPGGPAKGISLLLSARPSPIFTLSFAGWVFPEKEDKGATPDELNGCKSVKDLYLLANPSYDGKVREFVFLMFCVSAIMTVIVQYTVPVLWDKKQKTIVNNESSEIIRMFNTEFQQLAKNPQLDLYPAALQKHIDEFNTRMYESINNGVYRAGFARTQEACVFFF